MTLGFKKLCATDSECASIITSGFLAEAQWLEPHRPCVLRKGFLIAVDGRPSRSIRGRNVRCERMSKNIEAKKGVVADIRQKFEKAQTAVLVDYRGLTVAEDTALRNQLRKAGVEYAVLKNTMINLAIKDMNLDDMKAHLEGPTAVAFGYEDAIAPAKVLSDFVKSSKKMTIKCGVCDGAFLDEAGVQALANTPSREVLIAKIMGSMMSSVSKFVYALEAIRKQKAGEE